MCIRAMCGKRCGLDIRRRAWCKGARGRERGETERAFEEKLADLARRKSRALAMGGEEKLARRRAEGHLNARERIEQLLDPGSFLESGLFATSHRPEDCDRTPADGKIAGYGKIEGRPVALVSNDFTVMGASSSVVNGKKIRHMREGATRSGMPLIFLG